MDSSAPTDRFRQVPAGAQVRWLLSAVDSANASSCSRSGEYNRQRRSKLEKQMIAHPGLFEVRQHFLSHFEGHEVEEFQWEAGPMKEIAPSLARAAICPRTKIFAVDLRFGRCQQA